MFRGIALFVFLATARMFGATFHLLPALPHSASAAAMQLDSAGNIYLAGTYLPANKNFISAFVAKLSPGGSQVLYFTPLAGSFNDTANSLALASDGSAYVAGYTNSSDFPVTPGALPPTSNGGTQGFLVKVSPSGAVTSSTLIGGASSTQVTGLTLDRAGNVFLTGIGGPSFPANGALPARGFVLELNAALTSVLLSTYGYGGGLIALDAQGNIFLAGSAVPGVIFTPGQILTLPPPSSNAFQPTHPARFFAGYIPGSGPGGVGGELPWLRSTSTCRQAR